MIHPYSNDEMNDKRMEYMENRTVLTPMEAMSVLNVGRNSVYTLLKSGKLKGFRVGHSWRITLDELDSFMSASNPE